MCFAQTVGLQSVRGVYPTFILNLITVLLPRGSVIELKLTFPRDIERTATFFHLALFDSI